MPKTSTDLEVLKNLPEVKLWGEDFDKLYDVKQYKGKFVVTSDGKFIAKLVPRDRYDNVELYHNTMLEELGVEHATSDTMNDAIPGGGKIEIELVGDYLEVRLSGESQTYGSYSPDAIDTAKIETAMDATFHTGMMPVLVVPDFQK